MSSESEKQALADAEWGRMWREDSSLERWFPFTAEQVTKLRALAIKLQKDNDALRAYLLGLRSQILTPTKSREELDNLLERTKP